MKSYISEAVTVTIEAKREVICCDDPQVFIPATPGIPVPEGYYTKNDIVELLRTHKDRPEVIQYMADMLEE